MSSFTLITFILVLLVVFYVISVYNTLVVARQRIKESWSDIETELKRRYDRIPNLVSTVKGYAAHESETFEKVIKARNLAMQGGSVAKTAENETVLSSALKSIFALSESYPDLKANQNFLDLQNELTDTENKIQASRRFYNTTVLSLNTKIEMFPSNLIASLFHFEKKDFFELDEAQRKNVQNPVKVSF